MTINKVDREISDAELLFKKVIAKQKMNKFNIQGWGNDIVLPYLADREAWLGIWMLRADEICQIMTNRRLFNVAYQADGECMEGMKPVVITDEMKEIENIESYLKYPAFKDNEIPLSLKFIICQSAFLDSLIIEGNNVSIKTLYSFGYPQDKPLEHGDFLPCISSELLLARQMNSFQLDINKGKVLEAELTSEQSI